MRSVHLKIGSLDYEEALIPTEIFLVLIINLSTILKMESVTSNAFALSTILLVLDILFHLRNFNSYVFLFALIAGAQVLFTGVRNGANVFSIMYLRKYILAFSTVFIFYIASRVRVTKNTVRFILAISTIICFLYPIGYYVLNQRERLADGITINFVNPNFIAMWLLVAILYIVYVFFEVKPLILKAALFIVGALLVNLLVETRCRGAIFSLVFYTAFSVLYNLKTILNNDNKSLGKATLALIAAIPALFAVIYLNMVDNPFLIQTFSFLDSKGKSLTSRVFIWNRALNIIKDYPLFGNYYLATDGTGISQLHNTHLDILATYGSIVLALFIKILYDTFCEINSQKKTNLQMLAFIAFFSAIFMGCFEAALVSGGIGINYWVSGFILLARYKKTAIEVTNDKKRFNVLSPEN